MGQISFADAEYAGKRKKTRREIFLQEMELVVPWKALRKTIEPFYPVAGRGRRPYPLETMLRVHLMQNWFTLSDPAMKQALYARQPERDGELIHHSDRGLQYVSIRYIERLAEAGIEPSVGSKGDSYDNALAETINGLYKAEVTHRRHGQHVNRWS